MEGTVGVVVGVVVEGCGIADGSGAAVGSDVIDVWGVWEDCGAADAPTRLAFSIVTNRFRVEFATGGAVVEDACMVEDWGIGSCGSIC